MGRKTTTDRMRRARTVETKNEIMTEWLRGWEQEQSKLLGQLDLAIDISDFDVQCIAVGSLREVVNKKFGVLYRCLPILTENEKICNEDSEFYQIGRLQVGLIAILGRHVAAEDRDETRKAADKLMRSTSQLFALLRDYIPFLK